MTETPVSVRLMHGVEILLDGIIALAIVVMMGMDIIAQVTIKFGSLYAPIHTKTSPEVNLSAFFFPFKI